MQNIAEKISKGMQRLNEYLSNDYYKLKSFTIDDNKEEITFVYDLWEIDDEDRIYKEKEDQTFTIQSLAIENDSVFKLYHSYLNSKQFLREALNEEKQLKIDLDKTLKDKEALINAYEMTKSTTIKKMLDSTKSKIDDLASKYENSVSRVLRHEEAIKNWENQLKCMKKSISYLFNDKNQTNLDKIIRTEG